MAPPSVYVFHARSTLPHNVRDRLRELDMPVVHVRDPWQWPRNSDLYVQQSALSRASVVAASLICATPIVMPEGGDYLVRSVRQLAVLGDVYIYAPVKTGDQPIFRTLDRELE